MMIRFAAGLSRSTNTVMITPINKSSYPRTDEEAAAHLSKFVWSVVIAEMDLPDPPPIPPVKLVDVRVVKTEG